MTGYARHECTRTTCEVCGKKVPTGHRFCSDYCADQLALFGERVDRRRKEWRAS